MGTIIWLIGVSLYSLSFYMPLIEDAEQQANILLSVSVIPLVWYATKSYYQMEGKRKGYWLGILFFLNAAILDALITVPLFMIPKGGTYSSFFGDSGFWLIGLEFITIASLYWYTHIYRKKAKG